MLQIGTVTPKISAMPPRLQALVLTWLETGEDVPEPAKRERREPKASAAPKAPARRKVDPLLETRTAGELHQAGESAAKLAALESRSIAKGAAWRPIVVRFADGSEITAGSFMIDDEAAKAEAVRFARTVTGSPPGELYVEQCRQSLAEHEAAGGDRATWQAPPAPASSWQWLWSEADGRNVRVKIDRAIAEVAAVEILPAALPSYKHERPKATFVYEGASPSKGYSVTFAVDILGSETQHYMAGSHSKTVWGKAHPRVRASQKINERAGISFPERSTVAVARVMRRHVKSLEQRGYDVTPMPWAPDVEWAPELREAA